MKFLAGAFALLFSVTNTHAAVFHVDVNAQGASPNGTSWAAAFPTLQQGVLAAQTAGGGEVWVADGVYTGSMGNPTDTDGVASGDTVLILPKGVQVYGGFAGTETARESRDWAAHPTIIDGQGTRRGVYTTGIVNGEATLDGFIIRRGRAAEFGGGLYNDQSAPVIANCRFENNHAGLKGGGAFHYRAPLQKDKGLTITSRAAALRFSWLTYYPAFANIAFSGNSAGYAGGGLYLDTDFTTIDDCTFADNSSSVGGGVYDKGGFTEFFRCIFQGNRATDAGAGYCYEGTATTEFTNCQLDHNDAAVAGGAIYSDGYHVSLMHSTVAENSAPQGGGVYGARAYTLALNSIAYDNGSSNIDDIANAPLSLLGSDVEFATANPAQGVIIADPRFQSPNLGFFGLAAASPALDTGISGWLKVNDDLNGAARPQGAEVDMGALEDHTPPAAMDIDGDGIDDFWEMLYFGSLLKDGTGDSDDDGLSDYDEFVRGTKPNDADSDNDGILDGTEVGAGTDPLDAASVPSDVYVDGASGSDVTGLGTKTAPWATVAHAVDSVTGTADNTVSIHIAKGVYTRLNAAGGALILGSYEHLLGGYEAAGWTRNVETHETVLDASVAANGSPAPNVAVLDGVADVLLDGLTVMGAYTPASGPVNAAGILMIDADDTTSVRNCRVQLNTTGYSGSGGFRLINASPFISECSILQNFSNGMGGGIYLSENSHPVIEKCIIGGNQGLSGGGGILIGENSTAKISNCVIAGNSSGTAFGGGMRLGGSPGTIVSNTTIAYNNGEFRGGGGVRVSADALFVNCVFAGNRNFAVADLSQYGPTLEHCLFYANLDGDYISPTANGEIVRNGATNINDQVADARGNVDGDPGYEVTGGTWTAPRIYNSATGRTTLTDSAASFVPGELTGRLIALTPSQTLQRLVVSNTATTIEVAGTLPASVSAGSAYYFIDYHLQPDSAAIDMGIDTSAPEDGGVVVDIDGVERGFDGDGLGAATADGSDYDIGAFESDFSLAPTITVLSPNGGEVMTRGSLQTITWASSGEIGANVKVIARKGTTIGIIASNTPNDGTLEWVVPMSFPAGNNLILEISSVATPTILDKSDSAFTILAGAPIAGTVTVLSPNGGESLLRRSVTPITWASTGNIGGGVKIVLRRGTGSTVIASLTANDGQFDWTVPTSTPVATGYTIEISSSLAGGIIDASDATFSLTDTPPPASTLTVTAPNGGETYLQGGTVPITWSSTGNIGANVEIVALCNGASYSIAASTANDGSFDWTVPANQLPATQYTVVVRSLDVSGLSDGSNAPFTIQAAAPADSITILSPNGGENLVRGTAVPITWASTGNVGSTVKIVMHRGTYTGTLFAVTPNDGVQTWNIPSSYGVGSGYTIEISSIANPAIGDSSNAAFNLTSTPPAASITLIAPNGGETYTPGAVVPITWTSAGEVGANVEILAHGAGQTSTVAANTPNDGAFDWTIPGGQPAGNNYTIEVRSATTPAVTDVSNAPFAINAAIPADAITVVSPNGGEALTRGTTVELRWNSTGNVGSAVKIVYHRGNYTGTVHASTPNDGVQTWKIPASYATGSGYTIEISSIATPAITDASDGSFSLVAP